MDVFTKSLITTVVVLAIVIPVSPAIAAQDKLQEIHALCAPHPDTPLSVEIPCTKAILGASKDPIFNSSDAATQLFLIEADKLLHGLQLKRISEDNAREKFLRMLLDVEDRHRPELAAQLAQQQELVAAAQRAADEAQKSAEVAENRRANTQMIEAAQNREFERRQADLVAFCVATAKQRISANPMYVNDHIFQGIHPDTSCAADPYWYKTIPSLQSQVGGRVSQ